MLLLFIVGFVLFVTTAIMSDVCVQPDTLILSAEGSSFSTYFVRMRAAPVRMDVTHAIGRGMGTGSVMSFKGAAC